MMSNKDTPSPPVKSLGFRGFDSSRLLILRGGNSHVRRNLIGSLPESLTQGLLIGKLLVGGLGVDSSYYPGASSSEVPTANFLTKNL